MKKNSRIYALTIQKRKLKMKEKVKKGDYFVSETFISLIKTALHYMFLLNGSACTVLIAKSIELYAKQITLFAVGASFSIMTIVYTVLKIDTDVALYTSNGEKKFRFYNPKTLYVLFMSPMIVFIIGIWSYYFEYM